MTTLRDLRDRANDLWAPQEKPFTSSIPVISPAVVLFRRLWNSIATKWYVRPLLEQQIAFNSVVVQYVNEITEVVERLERATQDIHRRLVQIETRVDQEQVRVGNLETSVASLESSVLNQLREAEDLTVFNDRANSSVLKELAKLKHRLAILQDGQPQAFTHEFTEGEEPTFADTGTDAVNENSPP